MLAVNTAFMTAYLALSTPKGKFYKTLDAKSKHSENVLKSIDDLCEEAGVDVLDVGTVAVVTGPGSFTGLRIGVAIAKALGCVNKEIKFVSLSSLELLAYTIARKRMADGDFACVLNALSEKYFVAQFDKDGNRKTDDCMISAQELDKIKVPMFGLAGDTKLELTEVSLTAENLLSFAEKKEEEKQFVLLSELLPQYIRLSQAEDNLKKAKKISKNS